MRFNSSMLKMNYFMYKKAFHVGFVTKRRSRTCRRANVCVCWLLSALHKVFYESLSLRIPQERGSKANTQHWWYCVYSNAGMNDLTLVPLQKVDEL